MWLTLQDPLKLVQSHPVTLAPAPESWLLGYAANAMQQLNATRGKWHPEMIHRRSPAWTRWNPPPATHGFAPVSAFWFSGRKASPKSKAPPRRPGEPVMLAFHGGGYICGTAAETDATSLIYTNLVQYTPIKHVLSVDYRLANTAPWPLPLLDAISAYHHLVAVEGIDERDILLGGDSAGGHLAMALMRWIRDAGAAAPLGLRGPRALLLFSPWSDIGFTHVWGDKAMKHNADTDIIHDTFGPFASGLLTRAMPSGAIHTDVFLSPASRLITPTAGMFIDFPPMFVTYGEAERISLEINELFARVKLARKITAPPIPDELYKAPDAVHDFMIFPWFADESAVVLERLDEWLRELLGRDDSDDETVHGEMEPLALTSPALELGPILDGPPTARPKPQHAPTAPSPFLSPLSPMSPLAAPHSPYLHTLSPEARRQRHESRAALRAAKSPRMVPQRDTPRLMYADMRHEGLNLLDIPHLDLAEGGDNALEAEDWDLDAHTNGAISNGREHTHVHWTEKENGPNGVDKDSAERHIRPALRRNNSNDSTRTPPLSKM